MALMNTLTISDPWDFRAPEGNSKLSGQILKRLDSKNLLFRAEDEETLKDLPSRYWLLTTRYEKQSFNEKPYQGTVNGALLPGPPSKYDDLHKLKRSSVFAVIGRLQA